MLRGPDEGALCAARSADDTKRKRCDELHQTEDQVMKSKMGKPGFKQLDTLPVILLKYVHSPVGDSDTCSWGLSPLAWSVINNRFGVFMSVVHLGAVQIEMCNLH